MSAYENNQKNWSTAGFEGLSPLAQLVQRKEKTDIMQSSGNGTYHISIDGPRHIIYWDSNIGSKTNNGVVLSPATLLAHEADHTNDAIDNQYEHSIRQEKPDPNYDTAEEKRVITGSEQKTAFANGEIRNGQVTRTDHDGVFVQVIGGPLSNRIK